MSGTAPSRSESAAGASVRGECPSCGRRTLFVGNGGYLTCSWYRCPDPVAAHNLLATPPRSESAVRYIDGTGPPCVTPRDHGEEAALVDAYGLEMGSQLAAHFRMNRAAPLDTARLPHIDSPPNEEPPDRDLRAAS
jgi:hypothetical protein